MSSPNHLQLGVARRDARARRNARTILNTSCAPRAERPSVLPASEGQISCSVAGVHGDQDGELPLLLRSMDCSPGRLLRPRRTEAGGPRARRRSSRLLLRPGPGPKNQKLPVGPRPAAGHRVDRRVECARLPVVPATSTGDPGRPREGCVRRPRPRGPEPPNPACRRSPGQPVHLSGVRPEGGRRADGLG